MKNLFKNFFALAIVLSLVISLAGCGNTTESETGDNSSDKNSIPGVIEQEIIISEDSDYKYVTERGKLYVGVSENVPFNYADGKDWRGIDADLALIFAKSWLDVDVRYVIVPEEDIRTALYKKQIDCYWSGVVYDESLEESFSCSDPYLTNSQVVVVKNDDEFYEISTIEDIKDRTFAVCKDSAAERVAKSLGLNYVTADSESEALFYISAAKAQAVIISCFTANMMVGDGTDYDDLICTDIILNNEDMVVLFRKGSGLCEQFKTYFLENREDFIERVTNYGGMECIVPEAEE
ncbi:MAG: transporter substrate-binding domain-containing protein [Lachnospiraceae bacterium]|nr:transporter substrate-binding domain-containing protein [Lachnospiraceae bacterium]